MKLGMVSQHGTYMLREKFVHFGASFITSLLQTEASLKKPRGSDREMWVPCGRNDYHFAHKGDMFPYRNHEASWEKLQFARGL